MHSEKTLMIGYEIHLEILLQNNLVVSNIFRILVVDLKKVEELAQVLIL